MTTDLLTAAIDYALIRRWPIFPCEARGKKPLTEHGVLDATTDADLIWSWWERWPGANIGLACGKDSGLVVLDVDGAKGRESLAALESKYGPLPLTLKAKSGRPDGGEHWFFAYAGDDIRNSAGKIGEGLDIRAAGGYIIIAPSVHETGNRYEWQNDIDPAPLPVWLHDLLVLAKPMPTARPIIPASSDARAGLVRRARVYVAKVEGVGEGSRNGACFRLAGHLASFVDEHGEALGEREIIDLLADFSRRCNPPLPEKELTTAVHSAISNGTARQPKPPKPFLSRRVLGAMRFAMEETSNV